MASPPLRWPGGKRLLATRIRRLIPKHDRYVEPFVGSGRIFFSKRPVKDNVLADANCQLVDFYGRGREKDALRGCTSAAVMSKERVRAAGRKYAAGKPLTPCEFLALNQGSYGGNMKTAGNPDPKRGSYLASKVRNDGWKRMLRAARLECGDFASVMRKYDGVNTFFYLDPPYDQSDAELRALYGRKQGKSIVEGVFAAARRAKGKVMISYGRTPKVEAKFCGAKSGFMCLSARTKYDLGQVKSRSEMKGRAVEELVILNYDPRTGKRLSSGSRSSGSGGRRKTRPRRRS